MGSPSFSFKFFAFTAHEIFPVSSGGARAVIGQREHVIHIWKIIFAHNTPTILPDVPDKDKYWHPSGRLPYVFHGAGRGGIHSLYVMPFPF